MSSFKVRRFVSERYCHTPPITDVKRRVHCTTHCNTHCTTHCNTHTHTHCNTDVKKHGGGAKPQPWKRDAFWRRPIGCLKLQVIFRQRATGARRQGALASQLPRAIPSSPPEVYPWGFLHCIVCFGDSRHVFCLVSRSLFCSGSCPFSPQKIRFFQKSFYQLSCFALFRARKNEGKKTQKQYLYIKNKKVQVEKKPNYRALLRNMSCKDKGFLNNERRRSHRFAPERYSHTPPITDVRRHGGGAKAELFIWETPQPQP